MSREKKIKEVQELIDVLKYQRNQLRALMYDAQTILDKQLIKYHILSEDYGVGTVVEVNGHRGFVKGFKVVKGSVKPAVIRYKKDKEGNYTEKLYANHYVVQKNDNFKIVYDED